MVQKPTLDFGWSYPPGVTEQMLDGEELVECAQCGAMVADDQALHINGRDDAFCHGDCLEDWIVDNPEPVRTLIEI